MIDTVREFSEYIQAQIQEYIPQKYQGTECRIGEIPANNGAYRIALEVRLLNEKVGCIIHMDSYYAEYRRGTPVSEIMKEIAGKIQETGRMAPMLKGDFAEDFQSMKPYLKIVLVNTGRNQQRLRHMPHREVEDLSMICQLEFPVPDGNGILEVTDSVMKRWGISEEELFDTAWKNMKESEEYIMGSVYAVNEYNLSEEAPVPENLLNTPADTELEPGEIFYVLTNTKNSYGASVMLCPWVMEKAGSLIPEGFYIVPSSRHEILAVPKSMENLSELQKMVKVVNRNEMAADDILSDHIYEYDREAGKIIRTPEIKEKQKGVEH